MINLRTGTPGACKTLSAVEALAKMIGRWEKHPDEARPVFVHGVKDLALPHSPMPLIEWKEGPSKPSVMVPDWSVMPDGSFVLIDEAQSCFPPRSSASTPPPHVAWLNTHRHRGFDIEVITQNPKLIDGSVRALVGKHQHFRRLFGGSRSYCYEWDACSDSLSGLNNAVGSLYPFPKKAMLWYKSAEIHTKQKFRLPFWFFIPVIGIVLAFLAMPKAYSVISNGMSGRGLSSEVSKSVVGLDSSANKAVPGAIAPGQTIAPLKDVIDKVALVPEYLGCMAMAERCICIGSDGRKVDLSKDSCFENVLQSGKNISYRLSGVNDRSNSVVLPALKQPENINAPALSLGGESSVPSISRSASILK